MGLPLCWHIRKAENLTFFILAARTSAGDDISTGPPDPSPKATRLLQFGTHFALTRTCSPG